ncbi:MAG: amidase family protein, partial [Myxococcota bacterium]
NPYVLDRTACGSSSGSGSGVAANLAMAALGTETDGSIVCPSSVNGIVGLKPTVGTLSGAGIIPISPTQDTAGPMARTVADTAAVFAALSKTSERLEAPPLKGLRIGVANNLAGSITPEVERLFASAVEKLVDAGVEIIEVDVARQDGASELKVLLHELAPAMAEYLESYTPTSAPRTLKDLADFNEKNSEKELRWFGQQRFEAALEAQNNGGLDNEDYKRALASYRPKARAAIDGPLEEHDLAAIIAPTTSPAWPIDLINGDHSSGGTSGTAAAAGYPLLSLPMGTVEGLPVGATVMNTANSEWQLLKVGLALESVWAARKAPQGQTTLQLPGPN